MLKSRVNEAGEVEYFDSVQDGGALDYLKSGKLIRDAAVRSVLVGSESDLEGLVNYDPGTFAFTAGFSAMWQKAADGTWVSMI